MVVTGIGVEPIMHFQCFGLAFPRRWKPQFLFRKIEPYQYVYQFRHPAISKNLSYSRCWTQTYKLLFENKNFYFSFLSLPSFSN